MLHNIGEAYGVRPSSILGMTTEIGALEIDTACLWLGRRAERNAADGKDPMPKKSSSSAQFADPRKFKSVRSVQLKNGIW